MQNPFGQHTGNYAPPALEEDPQHDGRVRIAEEAPNELGNVIAFIEQMTSRYGYENLTIHIAGRWIFGTNPVTMNGKLQLGVNNFSFKFIDENAAVFPFPIPFLRVISIAMSTNDTHVGQYDVLNPACSSFLQTLNLSILDETDRNFKSLKDTSSAITAAQEQTRQALLRSINETHERIDAMSAGLGTFEATTRGSLNTISQEVQRFAEFVYNQQNAIEEKVDALTPSRHATTTAHANDDKIQQIMVSTLNLAMPSIVSAVTEALITQMSGTVSDKIADKLCKRMEPTVAKSIQPMIDRASEKVMSHVSSVSIAPKQLPVDDMRAQLVALQARIEQWEAGVLAAIEPVKQRVNALPAPATHDVLQQVVTSALGPLRAELSRAQTIHTVSPSVPQEAIDSAIQRAVTNSIGPLRQDFDALKVTSISRSDLTDLQNFVQRTLADASRTDPAQQFNTSQPYTVVQPALNPLIPRPERSIAHSRYALASAVTTPADYINPETAFPSEKDRWVWCVKRSHGAKCGFDAEPDMRQIRFELVEYGWPHDPKISKVFEDCISKVFNIALEFHADKERFWEKLSRDYSPTAAQLSDLEIAFTLLPNEVKLDSLRFTQGCELVAVLKGDITESQRSLLAFARARPQKNNSRYFQDFLSASKDKQLNVGPWKIVNPVGKSLANF